MQSCGLLKSIVRVSVLVVLSSVFMCLCTKEDTPTLCLVYLLISDIVTSRFGAMQYQST